MPSETMLFQVLLNVGMIYAVMTVVTFFIGLLFLRMDTSTRDEQKTGARLILLCWAWPFLLVRMFIRGIKDVWRIADFGGRQR